MTHSTPIFAPASSWANLAPRDLPIVSPSLQDSF